MATKSPSSHQPQSARNLGTERRERLERRRVKLDRKAKRAARRALTIAERLAIKGASGALRVVQKLNRPVRSRIRLDDV